MLGRVIKLVLVAIAVSATASAQDVKLPEIDDEIAQGARRFITQLAAQANTLLIDDSITPPNQTAEKVAVLDRNQWPLSRRNRWPLSSECAGSPLCAPKSRQLPASPCQYKATGLGGPP